VFTTVGGRLEPRHRVTHYTLQAGLVDRIFVNRGDRVASGQALFSVIQNSPGSRYLPVVVNARLDGTVSDILIGEFDEVKSGEPAVVILNTDEFILEAAASDLDAFSIRTGIQVTGTAPGGQSFPGRLSRISAEPDYTTGLFTLTFTFPSGGGARTGMPLLIELPVGEVRGIFVEPAAVIRRYGKNQIWAVAADGTVQSRTVTTGQLVGQKILISEGLAAGEAFIRTPSGNEKDGMNISELFGGGAGVERGSGS
jgi:multidrug efflux pump subunit AcrA (membrane-fusion protein)